jgi:hypothetical protein
MQAADLPFVLKHHKHYAGRAVEGIVRRVHEGSFEHREAAAREHAHGADADANAKVVVDSGIEVPASQGLPAILEEAEVVGEMR